MHSGLVGSSGHPRMLVVDDEEGLRLAVRAVFHSEFDLYLCRNSGEALRAVRQHRMSVAILDIRMEGESGLDLLKQLKAEDPLVEVIMLTAYETLDAVKVAVRNQACEFLSKPFDIGTISKAVARALKLRMASETAERALAAKPAGGDGPGVSLPDEVLHDVRNVMTVVAGMGEICVDQVRGRDGLPPPEVNELRQNLEMLQRHVTLALDLCARYMSVLRLRAEPAALRDIAPVLKDVCQVLLSHPDAKGSAINFAADAATALRVKADPVEVFQIMFNLGLNGLQSTQRRQTLTLGARVLAAPLSLNLMHDSPTTRLLKPPGFSNRPDLVALSLRDEGDGVPPDLLGRMFVPYVTSKATGSGVGMAMIARIVAKYDGLIYVETTVGSGTLVTLYFPQAEAA